MAALNLRRKWRMTNPTKIKHDKIIEVWYPGRWRDWTYIGTTGALLKIREAAIQVAGSDRHLRGMADLKRALGIDKKPDKS